MKAILWSMLHLCMYWDVWFYEMKWCTNKMQTRLDLLLLGWFLYLHPDVTKIQVFYIFGNESTDTASRDKIISFLKMKLYFWL